METLRRRPAAMPSGDLTSTPFPGQSHDERYSLAASRRRGVVRRHFHFTTHFIFITCFTVALLMMTIHY